MAAGAFCAGRLAVRGSGFWGGTGSVLLFSPPPALAGFWVSAKKGHIALTLQPSVGSKSTALGLELNPLAKVTPKGIRKKKGRLSSCTLAELSRDHRQALHPWAKQGCTPKQCHVCTDHPERNLPEQTPASPSAESPHGGWEGDNEPSRVKGAPWPVSQPQSSLLTHNKAANESARAAAPLQPRPSPFLFYLVP